MVRNAALYILLGLLGAPALAGEHPSEERPRILVRSAYAVVGGMAHAQDVAYEVAAIIDECTPRIAPVVGAADLRPVPAAIYVDRKAFIAATGMPPRSRVVGLATFPAGVIHIDGTGLLASIEKVVPHEVGHVMVARALGPALPALPTWFNEGIAEYVAGETAAQVDPVWVRAVGQGSSLDVAELNAAIDERGEQAGLAYAESASIVNFLVAERGETVIADLMGSLARTRDFETSLQEVTGWRTSELESTWRKAVVRRWRWPLLFQSPVVVYGVMVLLFLIGLVRYLRERRRRRSSFEVEGPEGW